MNVQLPAFNVEKLINDIKDAIQQHDVSFSVCCYVYDQEDRYTITEVVNSDVSVCVYYTDIWEGSQTLTANDIWTRLCSVDETLPVFFINRETGVYRSCVMVDCCMGTTIDFNVE